MKVPITICPPRSAFSLLQAEQQFAHLGNRPVSVTFDSHGVRDSTGIDFESYSRMQTTKKGYVWFWKTGIPDFVMKPSKLREVISSAVENRAGFRSREWQLPLTQQQRLVVAQKVLNEKRESRISALDSLCARYLAAREALAPRPVVAKLESAIENLDTALRVDENAAAYITAVLYLSYRVRMNSTQVASELGLRPPHVRQILYRCNIIAKRIESGEPVRAGRRKKKV
jgi:hypothetical protein